jgi:hypothetical protein
MMQQEPHHKRRIGIQRSDVRHNLLKDATRTRRDDDETHEAELVIFGEHVVVVMK